MAGPQQSKVYAKLSSKGIILGGQFMSACTPPRTVYINQFHWTRTIYYSFLKSYSPRDLGTEVPQWSPCPPEAETVADIVYRLWLQKRSKFENFAQFTAILICDQYASQWGAKRHFGLSRTVPPLKVSQFMITSNMYIIHKKHTRSQTRCATFIQIPYSYKSNVAAFYSNLIRSWTQLNSVCKKRVLDLACK